MTSLSLKSIHGFFLSLAFNVICLGWEQAAFATPISLECSNSMFAGSYGYTISGQLLKNGSPLAVVGRLEAMGNGSGTAQETINVDNRLVSTEANFIYSVNPDCTGSGILLSEGFGQNISIEFGFVLVNEGREFYIVGINDGTVSMGLGKHLDEPLLGGCSNSLLQGVYGYQSSLANGDNATVSGVFVVNDIGYGVGRDLTNFNGIVAERETSLTYTIEPNCTGRVLIFNELIQQDAIIDFVFIGDGSEFLFIQSAQSRNLGVGSGVGQSLF